MADEIIKLDPMVRKLETTMVEFKMALDNNDLVSAQQLLRAISQTSDFLAEDVTSLNKAQEDNLSSDGVNDIYAGGAPVMEFKDQGSIVKGDRPLGYIGPDGIQSNWQPQYGFGQRVD
tara:strand:+ start:1437 stop:1790 length:354 start_codon:yes stop_codon:yes gene_type:complete